MLNVNLLLKSSYYIKLLCFKYSFIYVGLHDSARPLCPSVLSVRSPSVRLCILPSVCLSFPSVICYMSRDMFPSHRLNYRGVLEKGLINVHTISWTNAFKETSCMYYFCSGAPAAGGHGGGEGQAGHHVRPQQRRRRRGEFKGEGRGSLKFRI